MNVGRKILFTCITTILFLVVLEGFFFILPKIIGIRQGSSYDHIVNGSTEIIVVGDSVAFGYGLESSESWPSVLFEQLKEQNIQVSVRNRAVSGNGTTEMGRERHTIEKVSKGNKRPLVLVMMGHNDFIGHGWRSWSSQNNGKNIPTSNTNPPRIYRVVRWMDKLLRSKSEGVVNWQNRHFVN